MTRIRNQYRKPCRYPRAIQFILCWIAGAAVPFFTSAQDAPNESEPGFEAFHIVWERNIFDATRQQDHVPEEPREPDEPPPPPPKEEQFYLLGTLITEYNSHAFFEGSSSEYKIVAAVGESIAGYQIVDIDTYRVILEKDGNALEVPIGSGMKRYDEGDWEPMDDIGPLVQSQPVPSPGNVKEEPSSDGTAPKGAPSDLLTRLMERRNQELQQ